VLIVISGIRRSREAKSATSAPARTTRNTSTKK
jgi:hypothetical protein